jgi:hypothetical protein
VVHKYKILQQFIEEIKMYKSVSKVHIRNTLLKMNWHCPNLDRLQKILHVATTAQIGGYITPLRHVLRRTKHFTE